MDDIHEARFGTKAMGLTQTGFSHFNLKPGIRQPFGHHHNVGEEVHVVLGGSGRVKLDNEILALQEGDVLRVGPEVMRAFEAGPDGLEFIVFSQHVEKDTEIERGWCIFLDQPCVMGAEIANIRSMYGFLITL